MEGAARRPETAGSAKTARIASGHKCRFLPTEPDRVVGNAAGAGRRQGRPALTGMSQIAAPLQCGVALAIDVRVFTRVIGALGMTVELLWIEIDVAQIAVGVSLRLVVEVL